jgi:2-polyprenyl-3-methyl-5-hydroxy-6-metoxy-1,4-benzoquinol methylase
MQYSKNFFFKKKYFIEDEIIKFQISDDITKKVANFYNIKPFPNYNDNDNRQTLLHKGNKNQLTCKFKNHVGFSKNILEVGPGTCQVSIYLAIGTNNQIVALDPALESLKLGQKFAKLNNIKNINFVNADIFDDVLEKNVFDFVWCNGVLHHTKDPYNAFKIILKSVKKDGYIVIGLYNKFGRIRTKIRKFFYKMFGKKLLMLLDPMIRVIKKNSEEQTEAWIRDQYRHPVESLHTFGEILGWFKSNNVEFVNSIPSCNFIFNNKNIFEKVVDGNLISRILNQISMIFSPLGKDGGLFVFIGKKLT